MLLPSLHRHLFGRRCLRSTTCWGICAGFYALARRQRIHSSEARKLPPWGHGRRTGWPGSHGRWARPRKAPHRGGPADGRASREPARDSPANPQAARTRATNRVLASRPQRRAAHARRATHAHRWCRESPSGCWAPTKHDRERERERERRCIHGPPPKEPQCTEQPGHLHRHTRHLHGVGRIRARPVPALRRGPGDRWRQSSSSYRVRRGCESAAGSTLGQHLSVCRATRARALPMSPQTGDASTRGCLQPPGHEARRAQGPGLER